MKLGEVVVTHCVLQFQQISANFSKIGWKTKKVLFYINWLFSVENFKVHTGIKMKILAKYTNTCLLCHSYMADKVLVGFHTIFFIIFGPFFNISWFFSCLFTKMGYYKNFFVYNPILTKFGEIVVLVDTTISPNFVKIGL